MVVIKASNGFYSTSGPGLQIDQHKYWQTFLSASVRPLPQVWRLGVLIAKQGSSSSARGCDQLDAVRVAFHRTTVATRSSATPCHDGSVARNGSKSPAGGLDLYMFQLVLDRIAVATQAKAPHVTTDPSPRTAAKALVAAWICCTFFS